MEPPGASQREASRAAEPAPAHPDKLVNAAVSLAAAPAGAAVWRAVWLFADADGWQVDHITGDPPVAGL
jgi:hypothetical protein